MKKIIMIQSMTLKVVDRLISYLQFHILGKIQLYFTNNNVIHQNELLQILTFNHEVSRVYSQLEWTTAPLCFHLVAKNRIASKQ